MPAMSRFFLETDGADSCPVQFGGASDVLVPFLSFAFATRYGAQHEYSQLALLLRGQFKIDLAPLLTFADRNVEEEADARELERAWQDAAPLAETLRRVVEVLGSGDPRVQPAIAVDPTLVDRLDVLRRMAEWAAEHGVRVRMTFEV
jgi:hypothetical protein